MDGFRTLPNKHTMSNQRYDEYVKRMQRIADLRHAAAVLEWDQETYMPPKGSRYRGQQIARLQEEAHALFTHAETRLLLESLQHADALSDTERKNINVSLMDFKRSEKLPAAFVGQMSVAIQQSYHQWIAARRANDFGLFADALQSVIEWKRKEAALIGYEQHPYDALLDQYDRGLTVATLDPLFDSLSADLQDLMERIKKSGSSTHQPIKGTYDKDKQWDVGLYLLREMGFDFEAGRQDLSEHPFTTSFGAGDVRLTTRIDEQDPISMIGSCIHEGGHGLYEQGLDPEQYGLPSGEYASLSIHESQSRFWENVIGRQSDFWVRHYPILQTYFPDQLADVPLTAFIHQLNLVQPSLIRTEADELTYHQHIIIRYTIEKALIEGSLDAKDIPAVWNEQYRKRLNINVPDDLQGCLQDVHWSHGSLGYFPTYTLGSLYAAQFWDAIKKAVPDWKKRLQLGETGLFLAWMKQQIFKHGRLYPSNTLCTMATGQPLSSRFFTDYLAEKLLTQS
jgi:carboxypeptidase Taq